MDLHIRGMLTAAAAAAAAAAVVVGGSGLPATELVFYNRIPKTGSTSLYHVLKQAAAKHGRFEFHGNTLNQSFSLHWNRSLSADANRDVQRRLCSHVGGLRRPGIFVLHMPFLNFSSACGTAPPTFINMVRDPIAQHLSANRFTQTCVCGSGQKRWCSDIRDRFRSGRAGSYERYCAATDEELVEAQLEAVSNRTGYLRWPPTSKKWSLNIITHWFCGMGESSMEHALCSAEIQAPQAVQRAKETMRRGFSWIGVLEEPEVSHGSLIRALPDLLGFKRASALLNSTRIVHPGDVHGGGGLNMPGLSIATKLRLRAALSNDYELYEHAVRMLRAQ